MKKILDCKIFNRYINKKYNVKVKHKIFGENKMQCVINGFVDDQERIGVIVHGKEIFCYMRDEKYRFIEKDDRVIMSDSLMEIEIQLLN